MRAASTNVESRKKELKIRYLVKLITTGPVDPTAAKHATQKVSSLSSLSLRFSTINNNLSGKSHPVPLVLYLSPAALFSIGILASAEPTDRLRRRKFFISLFWTRPLTLLRWVL